LGEGPTSPNQHDDKRNCDQYALKVLTRFVNVTKKRAAKQIQESAQEPVLYKTSQKGKGK